MNNQRASYLFIAKGASAELFDIGGGQVLKLFHDSASNEMIAREADASVHAKMCEVPTVAAIGRQNWNGRRGIIYPRLEGAIVMDWVRRNPMRGMGNRSNGRYPWRNAPGEGRGLAPAETDASRRYRLWSGAHRAATSGDRLSGRTGRC